MSTPADYYDAKPKEARELSDQLEQAIARKAPLEEIERIARRLEAAYLASIEQARQKRQGVIEEIERIARRLEAAYYVGD